MQKAMFKVLFPDWNFVEISAGLIIYSKKNTGETSAKCQTVHKVMPQLNTPDGFFTMLEQAQKKDWWEEWSDKTLFPICLIDPQRFFDALFNFLVTKGLITYD